MKKPSITSVDHLKQHVQDTNGNIKVDVAFLAYLNDNNIEQISDFIEDKTVIGFLSFLSAPLN